MSESRTEEVYKLLTEGLPPHAISKRTSIPIEVLLREFNILVGEGRLRRADVLYSIPGERRARIEKAIGQGESTVARIIRTLKEKHLDDLWKAEDELVDDVRIVLAYWDTRAVLGDMYEDIGAIEMDLYDYVERKLKTRFGDSLEEWWVQGIPVEIRVTCAGRHERDGLRRSLEAYLDLIDLSEIIESRWLVFEEDFKGLLLTEDSPKIEKIQTFRKMFLDDLKHLNEVRNIVMHPISRIVPTESDFECAKRLRRLVEGLATLQKP